ncbi:MAG: hypothetical protein DMF42_02605, partial [Verrucomicrobia bacterium]
PKFAHFRLNRSRVTRRDSTSSGIAATRTKVRIGDPRGAITSWRDEILSGFAKRESLLRCESSL